MDSIVLLARLVLAAIFALAGVAKIADPKGTRQSVRDFGAPAFLAAPLAVLLPIAELLSAGALLPAQSAQWGAAGTLGLLLIFIAGIAISLMRGRRPDCHCFGQLHSSPVGAATLIRNIVLASMAVFILWQGGQGPAPGYAAWLAGLTGRETAALGFVALTALWGWSMLQLMRQNGRLMLRLDAVEAKLGMHAPVEQGLPVDSPAPSFSLRELDGDEVTLEALRKAQDNLLLTFIEPNCNPCESLLPEIAHWRKEHAERLAFVLISGGDEEANRAKALRHNLRGILLQKNREAAVAYHAEGTPSAVWVKGGRIAGPVAAGSAAIHALVEKAVAPEPLAQGEPAPELELPDLDGAKVNLHDQRGRRTLLLFWNPNCGFCQQMRDDVHAWERSAKDDGPRLLVISTGAVDANRAEGFRAQVLLDQKFAAGRLFGVEGTPAAVLLDEDGKVASKVGVGAPDVLALARGARNGRLVK